MGSELADSSPKRVATLSNSSGTASRRNSWQIAKDLPTSFRFAFQGLTYAFLTQRNFRVHVFLGTIAFGLGFWLSLSTAHLAILAITITSVLVLELINTAIEAVVDLAIGRRFHSLAQIAKDCAASAVLVASIGSVIVASLLLLPPLLSRFGF